MKLKLFFTAFLFLTSFFLFGEKNDTTSVQMITVNADSLFINQNEEKAPVNIEELFGIAESSLSISDSISTINQFVDSVFNNFPEIKSDDQSSFDTIVPIVQDTFPIIDAYQEIIPVKVTNNTDKDSTVYKMMHRDYTPIYLDRYYFETNPLLGELVYKGIDVDVKREKPDYLALFHGSKARTLYQPIDTVVIEHPEETLVKLRKDTYSYLTHNAFDIYTATSWDLPNMDWNKYEVIESEPFEYLVPVTTPNFQVEQKAKIVGKKRNISYWHKRLTSSVQVSQNAVSSNWHKGGDNNTAVSGRFNGEFNYNNKKKINWQNKFEWRAGFYSVNRDKNDPKQKDLPKFIPNDDIFKIESKFGLKATKNFDYSTNLVVETQMFDNYKDANSSDLKAKLLSPLKLNLGVGMTYNYKKHISVVLDPVTFRYVYINDSAKVNPQSIDKNIELGKRDLKELGSTLTCYLKDYKPIPQLRFDSKLTFYSNYSQIITDWEIKGELQINRFLSTQLLVNLRYDNAAVTKDAAGNEEKARIQFKEILTFGFSYRFI